MFKIKELYQLRTALDWLPDTKKNDDVDQELLRHKLSDLITLQKAWNKRKELELYPVDWDEPLNDKTYDETYPATLIQ